MFIPMGRRFTFAVICIMLIAPAVYAQTNGAGEGEVTTPATRFQHRLVTDYSVYPFFYEPVHEMYGFGMQGRVGWYPRVFGIMSLGPAVETRFFSFDGQSAVDPLDGSWLMVNGFLAWYLEPVSWLAIEAGIGGGWLKTAFNHDGLGWINLHHGSLSFLLNLEFNPPVRWIGVTVRNSLQLADLFNGTAATYRVHPYYSGGVTVEFHPWFEWISIYLEASALVFDYADVEISFTKAAFTWGVGLSVTPPWPETSDETARLAAAWRERRGDAASDMAEVDPVDVTSDVITDDTPDEVIEIVLDRFTVALDELEAGDTLDLPGVYYVGDTTALAQSSLKTLNLFVEFIKEHPDRAFMITGYSRFMGNPALEIQNSMGRGQAIQAWLVKRGVDPDSIKVNSVGRLYNPNADEAPPVSIKRTR
jgi:outer membrane protein OmpA-like peptidoglycan-associated protein